MMKLLMVLGGVAGYYIGGKSFLAAAIGAGGGHFAALAMGEECGKGGSGCGDDDGNGP